MQKYFDEYTTFVEAVQRALTQGLLAPIKASGLNGRMPPLLMNGVLEELQATVLDYDDNNSHTSDLEQKFYYKKGFIDCGAIMRFLFRHKNNIRVNISVL